jgi:8-oxo-dGTP pyrophosphatase MutT (NUDIX family)
MPCTCSGCENERFIQTHGWTPVYMLEEAPSAYYRSVFLYGPSTRGRGKSWRPHAVMELLNAGFTRGVIYIPEMRDGSVPTSPSEKAAAMAWEDRNTARSDCKLFWVPRNMRSMPGLSTNVEFGREENSGRMLFGDPPGAERNDYLRYHAERNWVPMYPTLRETARAAVDMLSDAEQYDLRFDNTRDVPLDIWRTDTFQQWYKALRRADNVLSAAKPVWALRVGPEGQHLFYWALQVSVFVTDEKRRKSNEVVLSRPNTSHVVLYRQAPRLEDTVVVLVKEFRSRAATTDGYVHELVGGSEFGQSDPLVTAINEMREETGLVIHSHRLQPQGVRQVAVSASSQAAHLFSVEITDEELEQLREQAGVAHGIIEETERNYVEITTLGEIRRNPNIDWSMLGMIMQVLV